MSAASVRGGTCPPVSNGSLQAAKAPPAPGSAGSFLASKVWSFLASAEALCSTARSLNHELVRAGYAWWCSRYAPDDTELMALEAAARDHHRGLWSTADPMPRGFGGNWSRQSYRHELPNVQSRDRSVGHIGRSQDQGREFREGSFGILSLSVDSRVLG